VVAKAFSLKFTVVVGQHPKAGVISGSEAKSSRIYKEQAIHHGLGKHCLTIIQLMLQVGTIVHSVSVMMVDHYIRLLPAFLHISLTQEGKKLPNGAIAPFFC
jgi:ribosomal protein S5